MSMGSEWAQRGSDYYERALVLAGLGQSPSQIEGTLRRLFPEESAGNLGTAAHTAVASHQRALAAMTPEALAQLGGQGAGEPIPLAQTSLRVDVTFTYIHPGTGVSQHGFIRVDLPPGSTMETVREEVAAFIADMVKRYGDRYVPAVAGISVVGMV